MNLRKLKNQLTDALGQGFESVTRRSDFVFEKVGCRMLPDWLSHPKPGQGASLRVAGYAQTLSYNCGVVAGWTVVQSFWPKRSFERFYRLVSPDRDSGTSTAELVGALRHSRISVTRCGPTFPKIKAAIDGGCPMIACVYRPGKDYRHWIVVYGYGLNPKRVYVAGNRWSRFVEPNVLEFPEFRSLCSKNPLVCQRA
jgi:hypothetical protein